MKEAPLPGASPFAGSPRLSKADLAIQSAISATEIDECVAYGLIGGPDAAGTFNRGDATRLRLIKALEQSGIALATLAQAARERGLSFDFADRIIADPVGLTAMTVAQACRQYSIDETTFRAVMLAIGVAVPATDAPIREDDLELLQIVATAVRYGLPQEAMIRLLRSFAISMRGVAEAQRELFRRQIEEPALQRGVPYHEMFAQSAAARIPLQQLGFRTTYLLHRRLLEQLVYENLVGRFEEALAENAVERMPRAATSQAICFVDLSGFTERTEHRGDADAASIGSTLVEIAQTEAAVHGGSLVKPLGDGAMLRFSRPLDAVRGALGMLTGARKRALPPARAGIAMGPIIQQDGDFYGRTVNRAARLLGVAGPDQVLVTAEVAVSIREEDFRLADLGSVQLKGVAEAVHAFAVQAG